MFPELRDEFGATTSQVSLGYSLYLIPFAVLLLVSGTLGERWGRRRTVRGTYLLYVVASIVCALAPSLTIFIAGRALQGVANAFITPLLIAGLAELVPEERLGREIGIYSSFQALGGGLGPVLGGVAADTSWQYAFWGTAAIAALLALAPPEGEPRTEAASMPRLRPLLTRRMILLTAAFGFAAIGPVGIGVLVGVAARDVLTLSGTVAGLVLFTGSLSALVMGPTWGRQLDRFGPRKVALVALAALTLTAGLPSFASGAISLAAIWIVVSACVGLVVIVFQSLGATLMPDNRGGALSFLMSFRFVGHAVGPLIFIPLIDWSLRGAFFLAASLGAIGWLLVWQTQLGSSLTASPTER